MIAPTEPAPAEPSPGASLRTLTLVTGAFYLHRTLFAALGSSAPLGVSLSLGVSQQPSSGQELTGPGGLLLAELAHAAAHSDLQVLPILGPLILASCAGLLPLQFAARSFCALPTQPSWAVGLKRMTAVWVVGLATLALLLGLATALSVIIFASAHSLPNERWVELVSIAPLGLAVGLALVWHGAWVDDAQLRVVAERVKPGIALGASSARLFSGWHTLGGIQLTRLVVSGALLLGCELLISELPQGAPRVWLAPVLRQAALLCVLVLRVSWLRWLSEGQRTAFSNTRA